MRRMPNPDVHYTFTKAWGIEEGLAPADAAAVAKADLDVDRLWPGSTKFTRHFNPTALLVWTPVYLLKAVRDGSLESLGRALHCRQDSVGHGVLGLSHLRWRFGALNRHPDAWELMSPRARAAIERDTRRMIRYYVRRAAGRGAPHAT